MVKKGYYGNESLGLAWDCIEVRQMNPFYTTPTPKLDESRLIKINGEHIHMYFPSFVSKI